MNNDNNMIAVGEIINTQGHRGEVRVWPLTDFPERFKKGTQFTVEINGSFRELTIDDSRQQKNFIVIKFKGVEDMNTAEQLRGGVLKVFKDQLVELPEDTFYIFDLIGMIVITDNGLNLGKVKDVRQTGSNDIYVVQGENKEYLIPAIKEMVKRVDVQARQIIIKPVEGLLEL